MPPRAKPRRIPAQPYLKLEKALWKEGYKFVAGLDEVGRGAWAGPVVAAAVVLPSDLRTLRSALVGVTDSKKLSPTRREALFPRVQEVALAIGLGGAGPAEVDSAGLIAATCFAMERAIASLALYPDYLLIDAVDLHSTVDLPQQAMYFGDSISLSIAAASIIAKVSRDRLMVEMDGRIPDYGFARHKGYGTAVHQRALDRLGPCETHRKSYRPVAAHITAQARVEHA